MTEKLKEAVNRGEPVARNPYLRNLNGGRSRAKDSTMDPLKKPVPSGLGRPVKQQGLTHACWLESARQLDQPRTL